ncbi:MAG: thioredoxin [Candidatus Anstonellaceae archaeon]
MIELSGENFDKETKSGVVLVDFWAPWCGPCRMLGPIIEQLSGEMKGVKFAKVNVDEQPELAEKFGISSIPTLVLFKNGKPTATRIGASSKEALKEWISSNAR